MMDGKQDAILILPDGSTATVPVRKTSSGEWVLAIPKADRLSYNDILTRELDHAMMRGIREDLENPQ